MTFVHERAEARNNEVASTFTVVSTAAHDRAWWAGEAASAGTDWSGVVETAVELMVAAGIIEHPDPEVLSFWDAPCWREAAVEYHQNRAGRLAVRAQATGAAAPAHGGQRLA